MPSRERPPFIQYGGNVIEQTPLRLDKANMYGFFVKGKLDNLQSTVDTCLNAVSDGSLRFRVLSPYVMLTFTEIAKAYSVGSRGP